MKCLVVVALLASPALAEPVQTGFIGAGVVVGAGHFLHGAWTGEAAAAIPGTSLFVRVTGQTGGAFDFEGHGAFWRAGAGLELHEDWWLLGFDAGYQHETWKSSDSSDPEETHHGLVVGPRAGVDLGGEHVRFRAWLAILEYDHVSSVAATKWEGAIDLALGLGYRF